MTGLLTALCASALAAAPPKVFVIIGDSNAEGQATAAYIMPAPASASVCRSDVIWRPLNDPTDTATNVGSWWPLVSQAFPDSKWATTAQPSTTLVPNWQPGRVNYESMKYMLGVCGIRHVDAFLAHLGANDVVRTPAPTVPEIYWGIRALAEALAEDYPGSLLYLADQGTVTTYGDKTAETMAVRTAIELAWAQIPNVRKGPLLRDLVPDDGVHFKSDPNARAIAARWIAALQAK